MALTKTQINYLQEKLYRVKNEKLEAFKKKIKANSNLGEAIAKAIKANEVTFHPKAKMKELILEEVDKCYYCSVPNISIAALIPQEQINKIRAELDEQNNKVNEYDHKLQKIVTSSLDRIVLEGVDIDTVMAEFDAV